VRSGALTNLVACSDTHIRHFDNSSRLGTKIFERALKHNIIGYFYFSLAGHTVLMVLMHGRDKVYSSVLDSCCFYRVSNTREDTQIVQKQDDSQEMHSRLRKLFDVTSYAVVRYGSISDIRLSSAQLHAGVMAQPSFPHHSVRIKLISSSDICPIGSISYSCPPEERSLVTTR
jgi:hypothetical protein